jgi:YfiH family protein
MIATSGREDMAQGNGSFRWQQVGWGRVLVCAPLLEVAPHLFTSRDLDVGGAGPDKDGYGPIARVLGVAPDRLGRARQVHAASVVRADRPPENPVAWTAPGDVIVSGDPRYAALVRVADCVPILIADPRSGAVAAVHSGWRGTVAGAPAAAVSALGALFGARAGELVCAVGPSIGPCCYQVGNDVRDAFGDRGAEWFVPDGDRWRLDMWRANVAQLVSAGVPDGSIHVARECTACSLDRYFSYRAEGARAGRLAAAIRPRSRSGS